MAAITGAAGSNEPDMGLIGELMEETTRNPPAIGARKLLVEHYISVGWLDAALDNAKELETLAPGDSDIAVYLQILQERPAPPAPEIADVTTTGRYRKTTVSKHATQRPKVSTVELTGDLEPARDDLKQGYPALRAMAKNVIADLRHLGMLHKKAGLRASKNLTKIEAIAGGAEQDPSSIAGPPDSARSVARAIRENPKDTLERAIADLESTMDWLRASYNKSSGVEDDSIRDALVKRRIAVEAALPDDLKLSCELAFMHVEHEHLNRNYVNTETMLGDEVIDIPRANFYVTEDNYAWDMDELAQAITANEGVMRNPLSKEMFTTKDIKGILTHPLGQGLGALAVKQHEMSKGVRSRTIDEMEKLCQVLLEDNSSDTIPSRKAVDEFLAYIATRTSPLAIVPPLRTVRLTV
jgi:hypothetical protein